MTSASKPDIDVTARALTSQRALCRMYEDKSNIKIWNIFVYRVNKSQIPGAKLFLILRYLRVGYMQSLGCITKYTKRNITPVLGLRGPWGRSLVRGVPMREQRIVKHTLNSVIDILNLTPLFTVFSLKCDPTLSSVVN